MSIQTNKFIESQEQRETKQFPWKLHQLLNDADSQGFQSIVCWLPQGNLFKVHNKDKFASEIMPKYFHTAKYKSFQRSLNLWGFETLSKGPEKGSCFHACFIRGDTNLCRGMKRVKVKGKVKSSSSPFTLLSAAYVSDRVPLQQTLAPSKNCHNQEAFVNLHSAPASASKETNGFFRCGMDLPFPHKLHYLLSNGDECDCFISWEPDGMGFRVMNPIKFEEVIIPTYFGYTSYNTFVKELKSYGFSQIRVDSSAAVSGFKHDVRLTQFD